MRFTQIACAAALTAVAYATPSPANNNNNGGDTTLSPQAVQSGSFNDGQLETGSDAGQAPSATSQNNFINNCVGKTLTNGLQIVGGSCNGIPMGDIPAKTQMVSSVILNPPTGGKAIASDTDFNITVQVSNLVAGAFTNADATYYAAPQALQGGKVVGHTHVTVQDMGKDFNPKTPLDPTQFAFFKGINDAGNGQGLLTAVVTGGLPAGNYRVCTLTSSSNHQPVLMPVAQRGTADDCTKFVVSGNGNTANAASNNGAKGQAAAQAAADAVKLGANVNVSQSSDAASSTAASNNKGNGKATSSAAETKSTAAANNNKGNAKAESTTSSAAAKATGKATSSAAGKAQSTGSAKSGNGKNGRKLRARREFIA